MFPIDYHMHTRFSGDSTADMEAMCRAAITAGVAEIAFTEHFDVNPKERLCGRFPLAEWSAELERCRGLFAGALVVRAGLEASEPHTSPAVVADLLARYPFDIVIGSVHWVGDQLVFDTDYFQRPSEQAFGDYFTEVERLVRFGDLDVLGHLDVAARVGFHVYGAYDPRAHQEQIRSIFRTCIQRGIVPEINTGSVRQALGRLMPDLETLRWYVEQGGDRVVIGSDAHRPDQVAMNLAEAMDAARAAGVKYLVRFELRKSHAFTL